MKPALLLLLACAACVNVTTHAYDGEAQPPAKVARIHVDVDPPRMRATAVGFTICQLHLDDDAVMFRHSKGGWYANQQSELFFLPGKHQLNATWHTNIPGQATEHYQKAFDIEVEAGKEYELTWVEAGDGKRADPGTKETYRLVFRAD